MLLAVDAHPAALEKKTGVERYAFQLIQQFKQRSLAENDRVFLYARETLTGPLAILPQGWEEKILPWWPRRGWMPLRMGWEMLRRPPDVLFVPSEGLPWFMPRAQGKATVTTIHDVGFLRVPNMYASSVRSRLASATRRAAHLATRIITVSAFSKREIMDAYRVPADSITVTLLAADTAVFHLLPIEDVMRMRQTHRLGPHYFLFVGRLERKKNPLTAIRAFEIFKQSRGEGDPFELVFAGMHGFGADEVKRYMEFHPLKDHIRFLPYLPDADVAALMNGATAFLFPSWYEGFGMPNLEAMACGAPVICSDIPPHREVAEDAALFVSPREPEAWAEAMRHIVEDAVLRSSLREKGLARAAQFSWEKTAEATWKVFGEACSV